MSTGVKNRTFGPYAEQPLTYVSASATLPVAEGRYILNAGAVETINLPLPNLQDSKGVYVQDGVRMVFQSATAYAHKIVTPANGINGADDTLTLAAVVGTEVLLTASNGAWLSPSATLSEV